MGTSRIEQTAFVIFDACPERGAWVFGVERLTLVDDRTRPTKAPAPSAAGDSLTIDVDGMAGWVCIAVSGGGPEGILELSPAMARTLAGHCLREADRADGRAAEIGGGQWDNRRKLV